MKYYAVQVCTGHEKAFITQAENLIATHDATASFLFLQRTLIEWKNGTRSYNQHPLFPGYVFFSCPDSPDHTIYTAIRQAEGFCRFLKSNDDITPLTGLDLELLMHFCIEGNTAGCSQVLFDEQQHIHVTSGPLKDLEGSIVKINRRRQRARVKINFTSSPIFVDLSFEEIERTT